VLAAIWIFEPVGELRIGTFSDVVALALFFGVCVLISLVADRYRRNQRRVATLEKEQALREPQEKVKELSAYRRLTLEAANLGAWDYDLQTGQMTWDECCRNGFGFAPDETLDYASVLARIRDEDRSAVEGAVKAAISGVHGGVYHGEFRVVWPDGGVHWILSHGRVYFEDVGRRAVRFLGINMDITERRRAEDELRQSKREWERTFNSVPDLIAIMDNRHRIVRVNHAMAQKLGKTPEECVGLSCFASVHGLLAPIANCPHVLTLRDCQEHVAEVHEERLGGDFLVSTTPLFDEQGVMKGVVHVARNISERKRAEEELKKLNRTLRAISNSNQALLHATDEPAFLEEVCRIIREDCGHALVWIGYAENDEWKTVRPVANAGFEEGYLETLGVTWDDGDRGRGPAGSAIRTGQPHICRDMLTDPAFSPWREAASERGYASALSIPFMEGERALGVITIYSLEPDAFSVAEVDLLRELAADVEFGIQTLRTRAAHSRAEESLRESETRFRSVLDDSRDVIYRMNLQTGRYEYISPSAESVLGISREELDVLDLHSALARVHPDDLASVRSSFERLVGAGKEELEYRMRSEDGEYLWLSSYSSLVKDEFGRPLYRDGTIRDITAKKLAEEALLKSEKLASVGRMAATISHEINNPLAAVTNLLFLAQWNQDLPDSVRRNLEMADAELKRIAHITQQSLGFYRESNAPMIVRVDMVLESAIDLMKSKIKSKHCVIENESDGNVEVNAVAGELRQVFANLLANSLDAIDDGGKVSVRVSKGPDFKEGGPTVQVVVADNGKGINESSQQHIFEPFFTTKGTVGTGLGLWVTKQIIEKHQGTIDMRSSANGPNKGTVFTVLLPAVPAEVGGLNPDAVLEKISN
jgi:PAS domain S-box-containing protein